MHSIKIRNNIFMTEQDKIYGDKIYLRLMTDEDTNAIVKWRNNPRVRNNFIYQGLFTPEGHRNWIETMVKTGKVIQFIICEKETGRPVGSVYFRDICKEHNKAEYGIFIGEDNAIGKGIGSEVCKLACDYGFRVENWHKIFLRAFADNMPAIRSYEKAGFAQEAYLRDEVCIGGTYRDVVLMGCLNPYESIGEEQQA